MPESYRYPRRIFIRAIIRGLGRILFPLLTRAKITGLENLPRYGPFILVGNHTASMEVVMMAVYARRQLEFLGAVDLPNTPTIEKIIDLYGIIPVYRGAVNREAMKAAIHILDQGGMIGIFPEGGFWEPVISHAKTGVPWLSTFSKAPILPVGFGDTRGKLTDILHFKRPELVMNIGKPLPPVQLRPDVDRKKAIQEKADAIMEGVWQLVPQEVMAKKSIVENESFELQVQVLDTDGSPVRIPSQLAITEGQWLSRFTHRINLINLVRDNLHLPVQALKDLPDSPPLKDIITACQSIIDYTQGVYPYFFTYRYGPDDGISMLESFKQLRDLAQWALDHHYSLKTTPLHHFTDPATQEIVTRTRPIEHEIR